VEEDGIGAQVQTGGSGTPGGGGWDRGTGKGEEEDPGHLVEEDGIGAQVEEKRRIRGT
jgi:hypothetical protein